MTVQRDVIAFLSTPAAYGLPNGSVIERIDTHISIVWLAGGRAYKLKRAVAFDYVDFSTIELRRVACDAEVRLNRRTASTLYLGVRAVTREADGRLALAGQGEPIDWLVEMVRFDQDALFDRLAERQRLDIGLMDGVADAIARLHAIADPRPNCGGREGMAWVVEGNALAFSEQLAAGPEREIAERVTAAARAAVGRHADLLDARRCQGLVRACHGDLHLRNICLLDGVPTLFDGVEFNEQISCVDVLYDLSFLLMDLWRRGLRAHASAVFNNYLARTRDLGGLPLLPLFLSCRAAVRAKTSAAGARVQAPGPRRQELQAAAHDYLVLAGTLLAPAPPRLLAIGGFSGSGKSTLARGLAPVVGPPPGALILRSDVIRKRQLGADPLTRLGPEGYAPDLTRHVYQTIAHRARRTLSAGHAVIADAVFSAPEDRNAIAAVAGDVGVPFLGLWLDAAPALLAGRLSGRRGDVSDATPAVLDVQLRSGAGPTDWHHVDASLDMRSVQGRAEELLSGASNSDASSFRRRFPDNHPCDGGSRELGFDDR